MSKPFWKPKIRDGLRKAFSRKAPVWLKACRTLLLTAVTLTGVNEVLLPNAPGRPLTNEETAMLRDVFKDSVDYKKIRVHHSAFADRAMAAMGADGITHKNRIFIRQNICQDNYATCNNDYNAYVFMHEAVHIWQGQNGLMPGSLRMAFDNYRRLLPNNDHYKQYEYDLSSPRKLTEYNVEQQAGIITDYHLHVRQGNVEGAFLNTRASDDAAKARSEYERKLADFNRNPAYMRRL